MALGLFSIGISGFSGGPVQFTFPEVVPTLVGPPFAVMTAFMLVLDMIMSRVFMNGSMAVETRRLKIIVLLEGLLLVTLLAAWAPFFSQLGSR